MVKNERKKGFLKGASTNYKIILEKTSKRTIPMIWAFLCTFGENGDLLRLWLKTSRVNIGCYPSFQYDGVLNGISSKKPQRCRRICP